MTKTIPALTARAQFGQIIKRATKNRERFVVTKNGEASLVIMGIEDYLRSIVKTPASLAAAQEEAKKHGVANVTMEEIDAEIRAVRKEKVQKKLA